MRKDVLGEHMVPKRKPKREGIGLEEMVRSIGSLAVKDQKKEEEEADLSCEQPVWTLMWLVTEGFEDEYQCIAGGVGVPC
jgi:hypothetical protein